MLGATDGATVGGWPTAGMVVAVDVTAAICGARAASRNSFSAVRYSSTAGRTRDSRLRASAVPSCARASSYTDLLGRPARSAARLAVSILDVARLTSSLL